MLFSQTIGGVFVLGVLIFGSLVAAGKGGRGGHRNGGRNRGPRPTPTDLSRCTGTGSHPASQTACSRRYARHCARHKPPSVSDEAGRCVEMKEVLCDEGWWRDRWIERFNVEGCDNEPEAGEEREESETGGGGGGNTGGNTQNPICGTPAHAPSPSAWIVGGTNAIKNSWPWQVMVRVNRFFRCGGSILDSRHILTAAHCLSEFNNGCGYSNTIDILAKSHEFKKGERYRVQCVTSHQKYNDWTLVNDVAVLKLMSEIQFDDKAIPVCLPDNFDEIKSGHLCTVTGWGDTGTSSHGSVLQQLQLPYKSQKQCKSLLGGYFYETSMICFHETSKEQNPCFGDSGGPIVCKHPDNKWYQYGVVSWGLGPDCARANANNPAVFANVPNLKSWIDGVVAGNS